MSERLFIADTEIEGKCFIYDEREMSLLEVLTLDLSEYINDPWQKTWCIYKDNGEIVIC